jgi:tetratricopeptide (TPR) repeat protein
VTHHAEHLPERPELPEGQEWVVRAAALLIMLVGFFGAAAVYLETRASNRESTADRNAKVQVLKSTESAMESSSRSGLANLARRLREDAHRQQNTWWRGTRVGADYARAEAAAWEAVGNAVRRDPQLKKATGTQAADEEAVVKTQAANAYEAERDERTSQARRFVTVITDFAVALFLLGLVATVPRRARMPFLAFASLLALSAVGWAGYIASDRVDSPNMPAIKAYAAGEVAFDVNTEVAAYSKAIELKEDYYDARLARGRTYLDLGRYSGAVADLRRATQLDPRDFSAWNGLAEAHWWRREYDDALDSIERAARLDPNDPTTAFDKVEVLLVGSDAAGYSEQLDHLRNVLSPLRDVVGDSGSPDALERLCIDITNAWLTGQDDASIRPKMEQLIRDLRSRVGEPLRLKASRARCSRIGYGY